MLRPSLPKPYRRRPALVLVVAIGALLVLPENGKAEDSAPDHPIVAGFERFHAAPDSDAIAGGLLLLGDLNCTSCHRAGEEVAALIARKQAPILDAVGGRMRPDAMRRFLADPHKFKPGTTMPAVLATLPEGERAEAVEDLVHFLATTGEVVDFPGDRRAIPKGKALYEQVGCVACHGLLEGGDRLATSVPLGDLAAKYTFASLADFLRDPHQVRPSGRMPSLNLDAGEAREIAHYLLKDLTGEAAPNLAFSAYEGWWNELPDFAALTSVKTGAAVGFDIEVATRGNGTALRFEGVLQIDRDGRYNFRLTSDDGSRLWIDGEQVADNDGVHPAQSASGRVRLTKGPHPIVVEYFNGGGERELNVEFQSRDMPRQSVEPYVTLPGAPAAVAKNRAPAFVVDAERAARGHARFTTLGCASCHSLSKDGDSLESTLAAAGLQTLRKDAGCLAPEPPAKAPNYSLSDRQRVALDAAIAFVASRPEPPTNRDAIARTMTAFNCYACHVRDGKGGVEPARRGSFATTYQDLGDEGRIPPHLDGVGGKLTAEWLAHILADGAKDRPYMLTRMPKFGSGNVGSLADRFAEADPVKTEPAPTFDLSERRVKGIGRTLVGTQAFGCVQCHNFRELRSNGIPALDMTIMTRRLRHDWFVKYVVDPQAYRPGTRMPSSWPEPRSQLKDILDGESRKQIDAVWTYLSDGENAQVPYGIGRTPIPLIPGKEAIIYRGFIEGAGTRGIGVGYPEGANLAFDANEGRLALIWQGGFLDASRHWTGRGEGFEPPMGDNVIRLAAGPSFASLKTDAEPWPTDPPKEHGYRFRGYRLGDARRPTFLYDEAGIVVEDAVEGVASKDAPGLRRVLSVTAPGDAPRLFYRAATGAEIAPRADGWYAVDGEWTTRVEAAKPAIVREANGKAELLVPVNFEGGKARLVQEYRW